MRNIINTAGQASAAGLVGATVAVLSGLLAHVALPAGGHVQAVQAVQIDQSTAQAHVLKLS